MLELRGLTKSYPTPSGRHYVFQDLDLSFPEESNIGLIGPNGAGKSTLMRIIGGIDSPDRGQVVTDARVSWPVGLSRGMQKSISGRDNVRFICRVMGATGEQMREKVRYVEEFAELGRYFDVQVKDYSSGMRSRLAFGMSMAFDFDYYLIDEVTAVGDAQFRRKCNEVIRSRQETSSLIVVSHDMADIREWCDAVVLVRGGSARLFEDVEEGIFEYQGSRAANRALREARAALRTARQARRLARQARIAKRAAARAARDQAPSQPALPPPAPAEN